MGVGSSEWEAYFFHALLTTDYSPKYIVNYFDENVTPLATKKSSEKLRIVLPSGKKDSSFFEQVYEVARHIPRGRVTSYGAIAAYLGTRMSARMVGWAINGSFHASPAVPAHRVVNRNGMLSGKMHFVTPTRMQELLEKESRRSHCLDLTAGVQLDGELWRSGNLWRTASRTTIRGTRAACATIHRKLPHAQAHVVTSQNHRHPRTSWTSFKSLDRRWQLPCVIHIRPACAFGEPQLVTRRGELHAGARRAFKLSADRRREHDGHSAR